MRCVLIGLFFSLSAVADNLSAPFDFSTAKTLPQGVRNIRYKGLITAATNKYAADGERVPLGDDLNTSITWNTLVESKGTATERGILKGYLLAKGKTLSDEVGETSGVVNVAADIHVPIFAYGISDRWTLALAVTIYRSKVEVDTGLIAGEKLEDFQKELRQDNKERDAEELRSRINFPIQRKLDDYGYKPLEDHKSTDLGDLKLVSKYRIWKNDRHTFTWQQEMTFPTGREVDIDKAVDVPSGDGQLDIGAGVVYDLQAASFLTFSTSVGYIAQLPDTTEKRVPYKSSSSLSPDKDASVKRNLGDKMYFNIAAKYSFFEGFSLSSAYGLQYKERDSFKGNKYASHRYEWLGRNSEQHMHTAQLGLGYSTLPLFKRKKFVAPIEINLNYSYVLMGKNVIRDPLTSFELVMFF